jgi:ParB family transcriptional regulator, chromosome partitioning protein
MSISAADAKLQQVPVDKIDRNPDNPRIVFRPGELEDLLESIRVYGVQVPISVYREKGRYVLIDGERRWRCARKLNSKTIPALVQSKPKPLENLLLMFNIHALREQWDLLTIALKLPNIIALLTNELERAPTEREIGERTGLNRGVIRRCKLLMSIPKQYQDQILIELEKPKARQKFTEDLFIELERALTTVSRAMPDVIPNRDRVRRVLLKKFKTGIINNRVLFRDVARIARAGKVGADLATAAQALNELFQDNDYSIEDAFSDSVGDYYAERDIGTRIKSLLGLLEEIDPDEVEAQVRTQLEQLVARVEGFLRGEE